MESDGSTRNSNSNSTFSSNDMTGMSDQFSSVSPSTRSRSSSGRLSTSFSSNSEMSPVGAYTVSTQTSPPRPARSEGLSNPKAAIGGNPLVNSNSTSSNTISNLQGQDSLHEHPEEPGGVQVPLNSNFISPSANIQSQPQQTRYQTQRRRFVDSNQGRGARVGVRNQRGYERMNPSGPEATYYHLSHQHPPNQFAATTQQYQNPPHQVATASQQYQVPPHHVALATPQYQIPLNQPASATQKYPIASTHHAAAPQQYPASPQQYASMHYPYMQPHPYSHPYPPPQPQYVPQYQEPYPQHPEAIPHQSRNPYQGTPQTERQDPGYSEEEGNEDESEYEEPENESAYKRMPSSNELPSFDGKGWRQFIQQMNSIFEVHRVRDSKEKLRWTFHCLSLRIQQMIIKLPCSPGNHNASYEHLSQTLEQMYGQEDYSITGRELDELSELAEKKREGSISLEEYCTMFKTLCHHFAMEGQIAQSAALGIFLQGFSLDLQLKISQEMRRERRRDLFWIIQVATQICVEPKRLGHYLEGWERKKEVVKQENLQLSLEVRKEIERKHMLRLALEEQEKTNEEISKPIEKKASARAKTEDKTDPLCGYCRGPHWRRECPEMAKDIRDGIVEVKDNLLHYVHSKERVIGKRGIAMMTVIRETMRNYKGINNVEVCFLYEDGEDDGRGEEEEEGLSMNSLSVTNVLSNISTKENIKTKIKPQINPQEASAKSKEKPELPSSKPDPGSSSSKGERREAVCKAMVTTIEEGNTTFDNKLLFQHPEIMRELAIRHGKPKAGTREIVSLEVAPEPTEIMYIDYVVDIPIPPVVGYVNQSYENLRREDLYYLFVGIKDRMLCALWDPGSMVNAMREETAKSLGFPIDSSEKIVILGVNGKGLASGIIKDAATNVDGMVGKMCYHILPDLKQEVILGAPFDQAYQTETCMQPDGKKTGKGRNPTNGFEVNFRVAKGRLGIQDLLLKEAEVPLERKVGDSILKETKLETGENTYSIDLTKEDDEDEDYSAWIFALESKYFDKIMEDEVFAMTMHGRNQGLLEFLDMEITKVSGLGGIEVNTLRKKVADKVKPQNVPLPEGCRLESVPHPVMSKKPVRDKFTPENIKLIRLGETLSDKEKSAFLEMIQRNQRAIGFTMEDIGLLHEEIEKPIKIRTVPHEPWAKRPFKFAAAERLALIDILKDRLRSGVLEYGEGPYANRYFLVPKKNGTFRFIQDVRDLNAVTIKDANIPPHVDELLERFAGYPMYTTLDIMSGYDQIPLDESSRDLTAMITPLGLLRMTRLPQGFTNSVGIFERILSRALGELKGDIVENMVDDITIRPLSRLKDSTLNSKGIRMHVQECIDNTEKVLQALGNAGLVVSIEKSVFGAERVHMLGTVIHEYGREPSEQRIEKISNWKLPAKVRELRGFIALCNYIHYYVPCLSEKCGKLTNKLKGRVQSNDKLQWDEDEIAVFEDIKETIRKSKFLAPPNYAPNAPMFTLYTDAGDYAAGSVLTQAGVDGKEYPIRFESKMFNRSQQTYNTPKKELLAIMISLKQFRVYLKGRRFILKTDSRTVKGMLENPSLTPDAMTTRWITFCLEYSFEISHIPRGDNFLADALTRRERICEEEDDGMDIEEYLDNYNDRGLVEMHSTLIGLDVPIINRNQLLNSAHTRIKSFLEGNFDETKKMGKKEQKLFARTTSKYLLRHGVLWRQGPDKKPLLVVDDKESQAKITQDVHAAAGHRGFQSCLRLLMERFFWEGMHRTIKEEIKYCRECQLYSSKRDLALYGAIPISTTMAEVGMDHSYMGGKGKFKYLLDLRCFFSGWVEARAVESTSGQEVISFLEEDVFPRHGHIRRIITDNGSVGCAAVRKYLSKKKIQLTLTASYNPRGNSVTERGHADLKKSIAKKIHGTKKEWYEALNEALFSDRITQNATGFSPYYLLYGKEPILETDLTYAGWMAYGPTIHSSETALEFRQVQLKERLEREELGRKILFYAREAQRQQQKNAREIEIQKGDIVLVHRTHLDMTFQGKLEPRWVGPYRVHDKVGHSYYLKTISGENLKEKVSGHRLKLFYSKELNERIVDVNSITGETSTNGGQSTRRTTSRTKRTKEPSHEPRAAAAKKKRRESHEKGFSTLVPYVAVFNHHTGDETVDQSRWSKNRMLLVLFALLCWFVYQGILLEGISFISSLPALPFALLNPVPVVLYLFSIFKSQDEQEIKLPHHKRFNLQPIERRMSQMSFINPSGVETGVPPRFLVTEGNLHAFLNAARPNRLIWRVREVLTDGWNERVQPNLLFSYGRSDGASCLCNIQTIGGRRCLVDLAAIGEGGFEYEFPFGSVIILPTSWGHILVPRATRMNGEFYSSPNGIAAEPPPYQEARFNGR